MPSSTRHVVLDTETTGLSPDSGHRIVEIGCVEIDNGVLTGRTFHRYVNPQRDMPDGAFKVHGLSADFLSQHPPFENHYSDLIDFLQDATLVIHNAPFDMRFLNAEMKWLDQKPLHHTVVDTLKMARRQFPGSPVSLDALCRRFHIDLHQRTHHGALLDAQLLAHVFQFMTVKSLVDCSAQKDTYTIKPRTYRAPRSFPVSEAENQAYAEMMKKISKQ